MASTIPPILIQLQADVSDLKAGLAKAEAAMNGLDDTVKKSTGFFDKFKATFAGVFAADIGTRGLMAVKDLISGSIKDAQEYEKVIAQLNAGIKSTGNVAGLTVESMKKLASTLESKSAVDEKLILNSQSILQTFTNIRNVAGENNDVFNQATKAALDLSVKMGGDLSGASLQLGKALNDPIRGMTALRRVGVAFTVEQEQQIKTLMNSGDVMGAQKIILNELSKEFGGAAEAAGNTFAGSVARAKDKVEDFTRDLITGLQPILLTIGSTLGDLINKYIAPLVNFLMQNKEAVIAFVAVIGTAVTAFGAYKAAVAIATAAQTLFNTILAANPIGLVVVALAALAAGFVTAWNKSETFRDVLINTAELAAKGFAGLISVLGNVAMAILNIVTGPLQTMLNALSKLPGVGNLAKDGLNAIQNGIASIGKTADSVVGKTNSLINKIDDLKDKTIKLPSFGGTTPSAETALGVPATVVTKEAQKAADKAKEVADKAAFETSQAALTGTKYYGEAVVKKFESAEIGGVERNAQPNLVTNITVNGYDLSNPNATAQSLVSIAKYGQTVTVLSKEPVMSGASLRSRGID